jgi:2-polyprenyl-6-methoxyphenol hydroxylase-like FAD-dependent oxidoreductase
MDRAVVVGGSMAGLLAARALADHVGEVVIAERDRFPDQVDFRAGVPQARHAHVLLQRGHQIIEAMFPGITEEMLAEGARIYDAGRDFSVLSWAGDAVRFDSGIPFLAVSRPFLEHHIRRRVRALTNVRVRPETRTVGLDGNAARVTGIRTHGGETINADLVVDASGRECKSREWLKALGVAPPAVTLVKPFLGYASRLYQPPERQVWDRIAFIAASRAPSYTRGAAMVPIEGGRFVVTLIGLNGDHPPTDEQGFEAFARGLNVPGLGDWFDAAKPLGDISGFRFEQNRLHHFEACALPAGYVAVGDAVASFNPIYGQGMSISAIGAQVLGRVLADKPPVAKLPRIFHRRLAKALKEPWRSTTTEDLRFPGSEGKRVFAHRVAYAYIDRLFVLSATDANVRRAIIEVFGMTKPSSHLFSLPLALRAMRTSIPAHLVRPQDALRDRVRPV